MARQTCSKPPGSGSGPGSGHWAAAAGMFRLRGASSQDGTGGEGKEEVVVGFMLVQGLSFIIFTLKADLVSV